MILFRTNGWQFVCRAGQLWPTKSASLKLPEMGKTIGLFARNFSTSPTQSKAYLNRVTVIGGGHMGTGIAQVRLNLIWIPKVPC